MHGNTIPLGRILGIPIRLDFSWFLIFVLITWTMAVGYYPAEYKGWPWKKMDRNGVNQLPEMADGQVQGVLSREDMVSYLRTLREIGLLRGR